MTLLSDHWRDRHRTLITPEGIALPLLLAGRGARLGAVLIDLVLMGIAFLALVLLITTIAGLLGVALSADVRVGQKISPLFEATAVALMLLFFLFRHGYFLLFELGPRGATPGKRLRGIRVSARDGGRLTTEMVLARNLLRDIELFLPASALFGLGSGKAVDWAIFAWLMLFALLPLFNRDRLRAGDLVAGTWVVEMPKQRLQAALSTGQTAATGLSQATGVQYRFSDAELSVYGEYELQTLERVLREQSRDAMVAVHATICRKIGWNPGAGDERAFLEAYYTQLRSRLESGMRMGRRKASKND